MNHLQGIADHYGVKLPDCSCYDCLQGAHRMLVAHTFVVCAHCGNKRCPKATNHANSCTSSNEAGQPGSRYGGR